MRYFVKRGILYPQWFVVEKRDSLLFLTENDREHLRIAGLNLGVPSVQAWDGDFDVPGLVGSQYGKIIPAELLKGELEIAAGSGDSGNFRPGLALPAMPQREAVQPTLPIFRIPVQGYR